jgi:hypothetical protein
MFSQVPRGPGKKTQKILCFLRYPEAWDQKQKNHMFSQVPRGLGFSPLLCGVGTRDLVYSALDGIRKDREAAAEGEGGVTIDVGDA